ncbi:unnamed protein product, partial [Iphiclides podalirius]
MAFRLRSINLHYQSMSDRNLQLTHPPPVAPSPPLQLQGLANASWFDVAPALSAVAQMDKLVWDVPRSHRIMA